MSSRPTNVFPDSRWRLRGRLAFALLVLGACRTPTKSIPPEEDEKAALPVSVVLHSYDGRLHAETITVERASVIVSGDSRRQGHAPVAAVETLLGWIRDIVLNDELASDKPTRNHLPILVLQLVWSDGHVQEVVDIRDQGHASLTEIERGIRNFLRCVSWEPARDHEAVPPRSQVGQWG